VLLVSKFPHAADRINGWREVWNSPQKASYHMQQTLIALGSGGLLGTGLGQGQQKLGYLPTPHTDTIFAVLGEEAGFVGCLLVIGLYVLFAYRGFKIAMEAQDPFAALLASGVTCWITFEALINLGVVTGLLPFTGMVTSMAGVGLLLSVSRGKSPGRREESRQDASLDRRWGNRGTRLSGAGSRPGASRRG
jgi:cell division protein FtsW